jgi:hypothetical protein
LELRVWDLGFQDSRFKVKGLGVGVKGLGAGVKGLGAGVKGLGVGIKGLGWRGQSPRGLATVWKVPSYAGYLSWKTRRTPHVTLNPKP